MNDSRKAQEFVEPSLDAPNNFQRDIYSSLRPPRFTTRSWEWEERARKILPEPNFNYVYGSASACTTYDTNLAAFRRYLLCPSMLVNATQRDLRVTLFKGRGKDKEISLAHPVIAGPVGVQEIMHRDAEIATAKALRSVNVPMVLSNAATRTIEEVADANGDGQRWFQLYWVRPQVEDITISILNRAKASGYKVLVVTLDTFMLAWRPYDLDNSYLPFPWGKGCEIGLSDPAFQKYYAELEARDTRSITEKLGELWEAMQRPGTMFGALKVLRHIQTLPRSRAWLDCLNSGTYREWADLQILRDNWEGPIVLKGIQRVDDAHRAIEAGMDGIIVSNHGGRQTDGAIASLDALAEITADDKVKNSDLTILFDSGIRTGSDILKAIALGAKAVLIGRPYMYGLAMGGQAGVEHVFQCLLADMDNMLGNVGKKSLADLSRDDLRITQSIAKL